MGAVTNRRSLINRASFIAGGRRISLNTESPQSQENYMCSRKQFSSHRTRQIPVGGICTFPTRTGAEGDKHTKNPWFRTLCDGRSSGDLPFSALPAGTSVLCQMNCPARLNAGNDPDRDQRRRNAGCRPGARLIGAGWRAGSSRSAARQGWANQKICEPRPAGKHELHWPAHVCACRCWGGFVPGDSRPKVE